MDEKNQPSDNSTPEPWTLGACQEYLERLQALRPHPFQAEIMGIPALIEEAEKEITRLAAIEPDEIHVPLGRAESFHFMFADGKEMRSKTGKPAEITLIMPGKGKTLTPYAGAPIMQDFEERRGCSPNCMMCESQKYDAQMGDLYHERFEKPQAIQKFMSSSKGSRSRNQPGNFRGSNV